MNSSSIRPAAAAHITGGQEAPGITGDVRFYQYRESVLVTVRLYGLPDNGNGGFFAFHIHEGDSCGGEGFSDTGGHYNPAGTPHPEHAGDLPPLLLCGGGACMAVRTDRFSIEEVIGRTVVIHSGADDFRTQPAGNSGQKIACGKIRRV